MGRGEIQLHILNPVGWSTGTTFVIASFYIESFLGQLHAHVDKGCFAMVVINWKLFHSIKKVKTSDIQWHNCLKSLSIDIEYANINVRMTV